MSRILLFIAVLVLCISCKNNQKESLTAVQIINKSIAVNGGELYTKASIDFLFRDNKYTKKFQNGEVVLSRTTKKDSNLIFDTLKAGKLTRSINGEHIIIADSTANKYANSINSVHYFAYLPYGLNNTAVKKELLDNITIKGKSYFKIKVTFQEQGGGEDFEDTYIYWINTKTYKVDYLAYDYKVNEGGIRFRVAFNERIINGIRFVDYRNYMPKKNSKAKVETMDTYFLEHKLNLLSTIALEDIHVVM